MTRAIKNQAALFAAVSITTALSFASQARSAQITWTGAANGSSTADWQNSGNWSGTLPVNSTNTALFTDTGTYNSTTPSTIDAAPVGDALSGFSVGEIQFTTTTSGTTPAINLINSQGGIITLTGATGLLVQSKEANNITISTNLALGNAAAGNSTILNITNPTTIIGAISDGTNLGGLSGSLLKTGNSTLKLSGLNTYTGTTTVQQSSLLLAGNAPAGSAGVLGNASSPVQLGNSSTTSTQTASLYTTGAYAIGRDVVVGPAATGATLNLGGNQTGSGTSTYSGNITLNSPVNLNSATTGTGVVDFTGPVSGTGGVTKTGAGAVQIDNANNSFQGGTTVKAGTLIVNGALTGGGPVAVSAGTLGGTGSITTGTAANGLSLANGATLAPGLAAGGVANSGTRFTINGDATIDGTVSIQADSNTSQLNTTGVLTLNADSTLDFTGTSALLSSFYIIGTYGALGGTGTFGNVVNQPAGYTLDYDYGGGDEIALVSSTPEPGTVGVLTASIGVLLLRRRTR